MTAISKYIASRIFLMHLTVIDFCNCGMFHRFGIEITEFWEGVFSPIREQYQNGLIGIVLKLQIVITISNTHHIIQIILRNQ